MKKSKKYKKLVEKGVAVNTTDVNGNTPLYYSVKDEDIEVRIIFIVVL